MRNQLGDRRRYVLGLTAGRRHHDYGTARFGQHRYEQRMNRIRRFNDTRSASCSHVAHVREARALLECTKEAGQAQDASRNESISMTCRAGWTTTKSFT